MALHWMRRTMRVCVFVVLAGILLYPGRGLRDSSAQSHHARFSEAAFLALTNPVQFAKGNFVNNVFGGIGAGVRIDAVSGLPCIGVV
jgi:hypothetical protein